MSDSGSPSMRPLAIADARSSVGLFAAGGGQPGEVGEEVEQNLQLLLGSRAALVLVVVATEHLLGQLVHPREILLGQAEQRHDHVKREIDRDLGRRSRTRARCRRILST